MTINTRQGLADYALRKLGAPVINIEVADEQIEDAISDTMHQYVETHFDGIARDYMTYKITGTTIQLLSATGFAAGDEVWSSDGNTRALISSVSSNTLTINRQIGHNKFVANQSVRCNRTGAVTNIATGTSVIVLGDVDNGWIPCPDNIVGVIKILNITSVLSSSDYMFNMQYQIMNAELQALTKAGASMYWQTLNYLGHLDFIMKKERNFTFNRRMNRLVLEIAWGTDIRVGDLVAAEVYRSVDETSYPEVYDDIWVKRYTTALIKKQWGMNLSKYTGMQLPGGLTFNGLQIYEQAVAEIEKLEAEAIYSSSPLEFFIG